MKSFFKFTFVILLFSYSCSSSSPSESKEEEMEDTENPDPDKPVIDPLVLSESDFYTPPTSFAVTKNFVTDYGADTTFNTDDSNRLQGAINDINSLGGGKLIIPEGNYTVADIQLKSNVHIVIDDAAVLRPNQRTNDRNFRIFAFGEKSSTVENVSITGSSDKPFKIDLTNTNNANVAAFAFNNVNNFLVSDFEIDDVLTIFSGLIFGITDFGGEYHWPHNGVIKNGNINNANYGYGLIQAQAATNVYFKDISGTGGVTLRLETGWTVMNDLQVGGVHDIYAENVSCTDGNASLMLSPHAMHCGKVYVNGVTAISSGFGVRVDKGFVSNKYTAPGLTDGTFEDVTLLNIEATYGASKAQLKPKNYEHMPCSIRHLISEEPIQPGGPSYNGPSVAAVIYRPNYPVNYIEEDVIANGFIEGYEVVTDDDKKTDAECGL